MDDNESVKAQLREHGVTNELADELLGQYSTAEVLDILRVYTATYVLPASEQPPADSAVEDFRMVLDQLSETRQWYAELPAMKAAQVMRYIDLSCKALGVPSMSPAGFLLMGTFRFVLLNPDQVELNTVAQDLIDDFNAT